MILGSVLRAVTRKLRAGAFDAMASPASLQRLHLYLERASRLHAQQPKDKNKPYVRISAKVTAEFGGS